MLCPQQHLTGSWQVTAGHCWLTITTVPFSVSVKSSTLCTCFSESVYRCSCFILLPFMYPHMKLEKERAGRHRGFKMGIVWVQKPAVTLWVDKDFFPCIDYSTAKCCAIYFWQLVLVTVFKERIQAEWISVLIQKLPFLEQQGWG